VCRRRLQTVVVSLSLQSPGPSCCPGLGRLLASALLHMAPGYDMEPTTNGPSIIRTVALLIQAPVQDPLVCSSTGCSCGCRVPSSGAVMTAQRDRRRLQMSTHKGCGERVTAALFYSRKFHKHACYTSLTPVKLHTGRDSLNLLQSLIVEKTLRYFCYFSVVQ